MARKSLNIICAQMFHSKKFSKLTKTMGGLLLFITVGAFSFIKMDYGFRFGADFGFGVGIVFSKKIREWAPLVIQSLESKNLEDGPVFNRIKWIPSATTDTWIMQQSHHGLSPDVATWDRIAIVIDKTQTPKSAHFYQIAPGDGPIDLSQRRPYRASCFLCHPNGPRVIRPDLSSMTAPLSFTQKLQLLIYNFRIKTYGRVIAHAGSEDSDFSGDIPFRYSGRRDNEPLTIKTCVICHREAGPFARGVLTRQNFLPIKFMLQHKIMPPFGIPVGAHDLSELKDFILGF